MIAKEKVKSKISQMKAERPNTRIDEAMFTAGVRFAEAELKRMQSCNTCHVTEVITNGFCNVCGADQNTPKQ